MENKIVIYKMVYAKNVTELENEVNRLIYANFQPYGNPFASPDGVFVNQVMVKYAD